MKEEIEKKIENASPVGWLKHILEKHQAESFVDLKILVHPQGALVK